MLQFYTDFNSKVGAFYVSLFISYCRVNMEDLQVFDRKFIFHISALKLPAFR